MFNLKSSLWKEGMPWQNKTAVWGGVQAKEKVEEAMPS